VTASRNKIKEQAKLIIGLQIQADNQLVTIRRRDNEIVRLKSGYANQLLSFQAGLVSIHKMFEGEFVWNKVANGADRKMGDLEYRLAVLGKTSTDWIARYTPPKKDNNEPTF
jgi:hypothetical protein